MSHLFVPHRAGLLPLLATASCLAAAVTGPAFAEPAATGDALVASGEDEPRGPIPSWVEVPQDEPARPAPALDSLEPAPERDWDALPGPRDAHGMTVRPEQDPTPLIWVPRALLAVPRIGFEVAFAPVRGGIWAYERYQIGERARRIFFDDAGVYGAYPVASVDTDFGYTFGGQAVHKDLLGKGERISVGARYGGRYRQTYELDLDTGDRLGDRIELELDGMFSIEPKERFYGFGNADQVDPGAIPIDPAAREAAVATRYRQQAIAAGLELEVALAADLFVEARSSIEHLEFGPSDELGGDAALDEAFMTSSVGGYDSGVDTAYSELRLGYDGRRNANRYVSDALPGTGMLVSAHLGRQDPIAGSDYRPFYRYGGEVQLYVDLYAGSRILALRAVAEQVSGALAEVPFVHLPALGGDELLRGYPDDRFRDRALTLASAEYLWDLSYHLAAFLFVDAGRVQRTLTDPQLEGLRVGYGGGLQIHTMRSFLMRLHAASSIDGGLFFSASFAPVIDVRVRDRFEE